MLRQIYRSIRRSCSLRWTGSITDVDAGFGNGTANLSRHETDVERYWNVHTVNSEPFQSAAESLKYLEWRSREYPKFHELMDLWGSHDHEVLLDYGCGPGNDMVGFLAHTTASRVVGMDVSAKALGLARRRIDLHSFDSERFQLVRISDAVPSIPLEDECFDYIYCQGVLHHTSYPNEILTEFNRVLKSGGHARIMIYNRNSIWFHLYVAYRKMMLDESFPGLDIESAFARSTDGDNCPISRCYEPEGFVRICRTAGFEVEYLGGYLSRFELDCVRKMIYAAKSDKRLGNSHRSFLESLTFDDEGYPMFHGKYAGIGGVYRLDKRGLVLL
jgi:SAM-dependent methyltransferase